MMASMLPDLQAVAADLTVLVQPRLLSLFVHSFPDLRICSSIDESIFRSADRCYGLGSLGQFLGPRRSIVLAHLFWLCLIKKALRWQQQPNVSPQVDVLALLGLAAGWWRRPSIDRSP